MNLMKLLGVPILTLAVTGGLLAGKEAGQKMSIEMLINDLSSGDGGKRTAATKELFRRGKAGNHFVEWPHIPFPPEIASALNISAQS